MATEVPVREAEGSAGAWGWLLAAAVLLLFADGRETMALAAWLAPMCLLRFVRSQPAVRGLAVAYVVAVVMRGIAFRGMTPIPGVFYFIFLAVSGVSVMLPYAADRLLARRLNGWASTLVFPTLLVATQFVYAHGPFGSWGGIAYTQAGNLPLLQTLAVTGLWGIAFLIGWFAAVTNWAMEAGLATGIAMRRLAVFGGAYVVVILMGEARLTLFPPRAATVRVAALSVAKGGLPLEDSVVQDVVQGRASEAERRQFLEATSAGQDDLLERSDREAKAGAKIIFWSEEAAYVLAQDEAALVARGSALAARDHVILGMAMAEWTPGSAHPLANKIVMVEPDGTVAWAYQKARPTQGPEMERSSASDGKLRALDTPYGRLTAAICYDMDFHPLLAQAGKMRADMILSPASDWRAIDPRHTEIASYRAIEQGANLVRAAKFGRSAAYDYEGHVLAQMDEYQASELTLVAQVPVRGVRTVYSVMGDWFAWVCVAGFGLLLVMSLRKQGSRY
ncbi:MAG TPA: nitrilase-related carbon-nitrogen hydrolase [Acidobacteriaceae bacterium]|nr:nitrilase-related carbon-nitrogen hydrolase [Acidobacteriaceae bacterium]